MPNMPLQSLAIGRDNYNKVVDHLQSVLPEEGCGLLGGQDGLVEWVIPIDNVLRSPMRFRMDPAQQVGAMHSIQEKGLELVGIFHSHPQGPAEISITDLQQSAYPRAAYLIFWPEEIHWGVHCYSLMDNKPALIDLAII